MEDKEILSLYWQRSENAIGETANKYGNYCYSISYNILADNEDSEECVNDTYLKTWNSVPPQRPKSLSAYLAKIVRNLSINVYKSKNTLKRGGGVVPLLLDELLDCIPDANTVENIVESNEEQQIIGTVISDFLRMENEETRNVLIRRYFYVDTIEMIANQFGISESKIKSILFRKRKKLRKYLEKEGILL